MTAPIGSTSGPGGFGAPISQAVAGGQLGKDEFLKLLVAQMTHQDPMNPLDGQEMAAQLAQFSSVEQLMNLGGKLDAQAEAQSAMLNVINNTAAVGLIGREAMVMDGTVEAGPNGTQRAEVMIPSAGGTGTLRVTDLEGHTIREIELGYMAGGERSLDVASALDGLADGAYKIEVDLRSGDETLSLQPQVAVRVDGVRLSADGAYITAGSLTYPIGLISSIRAGLFNS